MQYRAPKYHGRCKILLKELCVFLSWLSWFETSARKYFRGIIESLGRSLKAVVRLVLSIFSFQRI